jgi:NADPH:quinone reductase
MFAQGIVTRLGRDRLKGGLGAKPRARSGNAGGAPTLDFLLAPTECRARWSRNCQSDQKARKMRYKRVLVTRYGGPEVISVIEEDIPAPKAGEVRVKVLAGGVSLPDVLAREGVHPETPKVPYTPGWDLVGTVDQPGPGVTGFEAGQTVTAMPIHGCYAQYLCVSQRKLVPVPGGLDPAEAVAVVLNYITAYQMLHRSAKAKPGQRMLIHGAAGGVGSAMLQLAKLAGVEMYGTCSVRVLPSSGNWAASRSTTRTRIS